MSTGDFIARNAKTIAVLWKTVTHCYGVTEREFTERLAAIGLRAGIKSEAPGETNGSSHAGVLLSNIKANELCLAIACEMGDEAAWRKLETDYRYSMQAAARVLTQDEAEAEELTQFVFGELYGVRMDGDRRMSKLRYYSGQGSFGGWLRAVVYQCFIDRRRQTARFEQVEEIEEFDRLAMTAATHLNGSDRKSVE